MKILVSELVSMPPKPTAAMVEFLWDFYRMDKVQTEQIYAGLIRAWATDIRDGIVEITA